MLLCQIVRSLSLIVLRKNIVMVSLLTWVPKISELEMADTVCVLFGTVVGIHWALNLCLLDELVNGKMSFIRKEPWLWTQKTSLQIPAVWPRAWCFPHHASGSPSVKWVQTYLQRWEGRFQTVKHLAWSKGSKKHVYQLSKIFWENTENRLNTACGRNSCAGWDSFLWPQGLG